MSSNMGVETETQPALRGAQEAAEHIHPLSEPAITVASVGQGARADLDAADGFQDAYIKPLRILNDIIEKIAETANVWTLFLIGTQLI